MSNEKEYNININLEMSYLFKFVIFRVTFLLNNYISREEMSDNYK